MLYFSWVRPASMPARGSQCKKCKRHRWLLWWCCASLAASVFFWGDLRCFVVWAYLRLAAQELVT